MVWIFPLIIALFALAIYNYQYITISDLDVISYVLAKSTLKTFPKVYPKNDTVIANRVRSLIRYPLLYALQPLTLLFNPSLSSIPYEDVKIPVDEGKSTILLRLYNTQKQKQDHQDQTQEIKKKVMIFYHGGGWIFFSAPELHAVTLQIAQSTGYLVVSVDYRLAPEHVFPTAVNDAYTALEWTIANIEKYGGDPNAIIVGGESAGGNLAAAVTSHHLIQKFETICNVKLRPHDPDQMLCSKIFQKDQAGEKWHEIIGLWLVYPVLSATTDSSEAKKHAYVSGFLTIDEMEWMRRLYQGSDDYNEKIRTNYLYAPAHTPNVIISAYPSTLFIFAEHDILTQEGMEFAERLRSYLRPVHMMTFTSTIHAFLSAHPFLGPKAIEYSANYFRQAFT